MYIIFRPMGRQLVETSKLICSRTMATLAKTSPSLHRPKKATTLGRSEIRHTSRRLSQSVMSESTAIWSCRQTRLVKLGRAVRVGWGDRFGIHQRSYSRYVQLALPSLPIRCGGIILAPEHVYVRSNPGRTPHSRDMSRRRSSTRGTCTIADPAPLSIESDH